VLRTTSRCQTWEATHSVKQWYTYFAGYTGKQIIFLCFLKYLVWWLGIEITYHLLIFRKEKRPHTWKCPGHIGKSSLGPFSPPALKKGSRGEYMRTSLANGHKKIKKIEKLQRSNVLSNPELSHLWNKSLPCHPYVRYSTRNSPGDPLIIYTTSLIFGYHLS